MRYNTYKCHKNNLLQTNNTPPWQSFRNVGGVSPIRDLKWRDGAVCVNETTLVAPLIGAGTIGPSSFGALP